MKKVLQLNTNLDDKLLPAFKELAKICHGEVVLFSAPNSYIIIGDEESEKILKMVTEEAEKQTSTS